jgi:hypothetical protein
MQIIINIDGEKVQAIERKPKPEKPSTKESDLHLRLLNQDSLEDDEKVKLEGEIVLHVRNLLKKKQKGTALTFLKSIKDSMSEELRDMISEELKLI